MAEMAERKCQKRGAPANKVKSVYTIAEERSVCLTPRRVNIGKFMNFKLHLCVRLISNKGNLVPTMS